MLTELEQHETALRKLRQDSAELELSPSYLMITDPAVGAETKRVHKKATAAAKDLWLYIQAATIQLKKAREYAEQSGAAGTAVVELQRLLQQKWYTITDLSAGQPQTLSTRETLAEVRRCYDLTRSAVTEIDQLWRATLPQIEAAKETLNRLQKEADELGITEPLIGKAELAATDLAERLTSDPATATIADGEDVSELVAEAARQITALQAGRDNLDTDLMKTEVLLASLRELRSGAEAARIEAEEKIVEPNVVKVPSSQIFDGPDGIAERLDTVLSMAKSTEWTQKRGVLDLWLETARKLETQLTAAGNQNRQALDKRDELRGRLRAFTAKAAGLGQSENMEIMKLVDQARSELYTAPTDLIAAAATVKDLAVRLQK